MLEGFVDPDPPLKVIAVAVEEFEAWLLADLDAIGAVLGIRPLIPSKPEALGRGVAKQLLSTAIRTAASSSGRSARVYRREIAEQCDLEVLTSLCSGFQGLRTDLRRVPGSC